MSEVGDIKQQISLLGGGVIRLHVEGVDLLVDGADLGFDRRSILALAFEHADLLGNGFPRILQLLLGGFQSAAGFVAGEHRGDEFPVIAAAGFEAVLNGGGVVAEDADIEHGGATLTGDGVENQREFLEPRNICITPAAGEFAAKVRQCAASRLPPRLPGAAALPRSARPPPPGLPRNRSCWTCDTVPSGECAQY